MTVTKDKLIFISANNQIPEKSVMHSYKLNDLTNIFKKEYSNTGHGNGMTYNSKTDKVLVTVGNNNSIYEYNGETLIIEKEYPRPTYPIFSAIGYDYNNDLYIGIMGGRIFLADTINLRRLTDFCYLMFETEQDLEYYNGYIFTCNTDFGVDIKHQSYSFFTGYEIIYIYDAKLDNNKKPTKNFGRLIARLIMTKLGELEGISFRNGYIYFAFATKGYNFYKLDYKTFAEKIKKIS